MLSVLPIGPVAIAATQTSYHNRKKAGTHNEGEKRKKNPFNNIAHIQYYYFKSIISVEAFIMTY